MTSAEFSQCRKRMNKTQKEMGQLLGTSIKAIHSYEQGWRNIPPHVERQVYFLLSRVRNREKPKKPCWVVKKCPTQTRTSCPAWQFRSGDLCWFINGTVCQGKVQATWRQKIKLCRSCDVFIQIID